MALVLVTALVSQGCAKEFFSFSNSGLQLCSETGTETQILPLSVSTQSSTNVNVVFVIDTSGSMDNEIAQVRANVAQFVTDVKGTLNPNTTKFAVIGTSNSGDVLPAPYVKNGTYNQVYWHHQAIGSKDKLRKLMRAYGMTTFLSGGVSRILGTTVPTFPEFDALGACDATSTLFNCNSLNHIVIVTDDIEALPNTTGQDNTRDAFMGSFGDHLKINRNAFKMHGIHAKATSSCSVAAYGKIYEDMATATGALSHDVCTANWTILFNSLKDQIFASAKAMEFGQCLAPNRTIGSVKVKWGTQVVTLGTSDYVFTAAADAFSLPTIYVPSASLTANNVPTDGTALSLVIDSSWTQ